MDDDLSTFIQVGDPLAPLLADIYRKMKARQEAERVAEQMGK